MLSTVVSRQAKQDKLIFLVVWKHTKHFYSPFKFLDTDFTSLEEHKMQILAFALVTSDFYHHPLTFFKMVTFQISHTLKYVGILP